MSVAFVLGNGTSRRKVDLHRLTRYGKVYGCNALYREFTPDVLVATDQPIATAIQESEYAKQHVFYTRKPIANSGALRLGQKYFAYSSGPNAIVLAAKESPTTIYLLGFDLGGINGKVNNLYAGTEFYKGIAETETFYGNWARQIQQICSDFSTIRFVRVVGDNTLVNGVLSEIPNLVNMPMDNFLDELNSNKGLL